MNIADLYFRALLDTRQLETEIVQKGTAAANKAGTAAGRSFGSRLAGAAGRGLAVFGGTAGFALAGATESAIALEDQLRTIQTVAPDIDLSKLEDDIQSVSRETGKTTDDLTAGFYDLVSAGVDADQAINVLRDSAKFATGALGSTAESVDLVTSVMNAYGLEASDSARITDVFAKAVADGKVTAAELGASIANIAPIANSAGVSMEEVSAGYALLTAKGVPAAQAATQMRAAISALLTPNSQLNKIQKETGVNFAELTRSKGLAVALEELRKATNGNADAFAKSLGSIDAYQFALATTGENAEAMAEQIVESSQSAGLAQEQYDIKSQSMAEQGKRLAATFHTLAQDIGGTVAPFGQLFFAANQIAPALNGLITPARLLGTTFGSLAGKALPGLVRGLSRIPLGPFRSIGARIMSAIAGGLVGNAATNIVSEGVADSVSAGVDKAGKSSKLKAATGRLGKFLGSGLGKALSVAFAAAAVIGVIETYDQVRAGLNEQAEGINASVKDQVARGTTESLEQSKAALEQGIKELGGVMDFGLFTNEQRANLQAQLDATNAELARRAAGGTVAAGDAMRANAGYMKDAAKDAIYDPAVEAADGAAKDAAARAGQIPQEIADAIRSKRSAIDSAFSTLQSDLKNQQPRWVEQAKLVGILTSEALADGLKSRDPVVVAQAQETQRLAEERLKELTYAGSRIGKGTGDELKKGLNSKDPDVRAAALRTKGIIEANIKASTRPKGQAAGQDYIDGLNSKQGKAQQAARLFALAIANGISATLLGEADRRRQGSGRGPGRASGGPVEAGRPYIVGEHRRELFVPEVDGRIQSNVPSRRDEAESAGAGGNTYNVTLQGLLRAEDPLEVARQMRRLQDFGVLA